MGVKIARALGCTVTVISRSRSKVVFAAQIGASGGFIDSTSPSEMLSAARSFDLVLNTIPGEHDYTIYTALVKSTGKHVILGVNTAMGACTLTRKFLCNPRVVHSGIGSIAETQACIDLCAAHDIRPETRIIPVEGINAAFEALDKANDAGLRYVIDLKGSLNQDAAERCRGVPPPKLKPHVPMTVGAVAWTLCGMIFLGHAW